MILGHVRDYFPRITLTLPGLAGPAAIEFILDTGFDGQLALPGSVLNAMDASYEGNRPVQLADGSERPRPTYSLVLESDDAPRLVEVILLEGVPLLGVELLAETLIQIEMMDGGEVSIEPL